MSRFLKKTHYSDIRVASTRRRLTLIAVSLVLFGCESLPPPFQSISTRFVTGLSAEERALAAQLPVYTEALPPDTFTPVDEVIGISCQATSDDHFRVSREHAIRELQAAAVLAGANAVMAVRCEEPHHRTGTRSCFRSIECHGMAIYQRHDGASRYPETDAPGSAKR